MHENVLSEMLPFFSERFGNASSKWHEYGWDAKAHVEDSRKTIAESIGAEPGEIVFTSGSTESLNTALKGLAEVYIEKRHLVCVSTEHNAVLETAEYLKSKGIVIELLPVDAEGKIDLDLLEKILREDTLAFCAMAVNNETGVIHDLESIGKICKDKKCFFVCDTTQAIGKMQVNVQEMQMDVLCISAHKIYGPKGVGALYLRRKNPRVKIAAMLLGGGHEEGLRSGTLNVPGIIGLGSAVNLVQNNYWEYTTHYSKLRNYLEHQLLDLPGLRINGSTRYRVSNTSNLCFQGEKAEDIIRFLKGFAVSTGSACSSAIAKPSHVLKAMGLSDEDAYSSIRFSIGCHNTLNEIKQLTTQILKYYEEKGRR